MTAIIGSIFFGIGTSLFGLGSESMSFKNCADGRL